MPPPTRFLSLLLLVATIAACASVAGVPIDEAAEVATMGRERPLNAPMRPIRGTTRVLILALDGVGHDDLHRALRDGRMPRLATMLGQANREEPDLFAHAYSVPGMVSVLPSSTIPAWVAAFTGRAPAETGVPGNEWFVREEMEFYAPVPVSVGSRDHATRLFTDELLSDLVETPTVFERLALRSHVASNPVFRGADLLTVPNLSNLGDLVEEMAEGAVSGGAAENPGVHRETDQASVRSLIGAIEDYGVPDVQVAYFPGIDLYTHDAEGPVEAQQRYLAEVTDPAIGEILEAYRDAGALGDTYIVVVSDHGHTPVLNDDPHALGTGGDGEPARVLEDAGFRVRPFSLHTAGNDFQAVLAYQGALAFLYLADRSSCTGEGQRCDWRSPPRFEEDVVPAARAFFEANRSDTSDLRGTLDLILARRPAPVREDALPFEVFDGEGLIPVAEYLRREPRPDLLRLEERLRYLAVGPRGHRAGDVILLARTGTERPIEERYHFSGPSHSEHGGAHAQDSHIPLIVGHAGHTGARIRELVRDVLGEQPSQLDLAGLLEGLLQH